VCVCACCMVQGSNPSGEQIFHTHLDQAPKTYPASYMVDTRSSLGVKQLGHGADRPPHSSIDCEWVGSIPLPPLCTCTGMTWNDLYHYPYLHILEFSYNNSQQDALFLNFILVKNSVCFREIYCPLSGVVILYSQKLVFVMLVMLPVC
jgi:hypothetical protein